jgi:hypothetical protein
MFAPAKLRCGFRDLLEVWLCQNKVEAHHASGRIQVAKTVIKQAYDANPPQLELTGHILEPAGPWAQNP